MSQRGFGLGRSTRAYAKWPASGQADGPFGLNRSAEARSLGQPVPQSALEFVMRVAAVDFGKVRVGLALSDELGAMAHPRPHLDGTNLKALLAELAALAEKESLSGFIVGLPRSLDGREGPPARRARQFAKLLKQHSGLPVEMVDEWLTTREAQSRLSAQGLNTRESRSRIDSAAAAVLLQAWLDARGYRREGPGG